MIGLESKAAVVDNEEEVMMNERNVNSKYLKSIL